MVAVECLVLIQKIILGDEAAVDITVLEVDHVLAFVVDVWDFTTCSLAERTLEDEEMAMAEDHSATLESGVASRFAVKDTGKLGGYC